MVKGNKAALAIIEEQKSKGVALNTKEQNEAANEALKREQIAQRLPDARALAQAIEEGKPADEKVEESEGKKK